jgi:hypothetical protein
MTYRKNQFMSNLQNALKSGLIVTAGFVTHKVLTNLLCDRVLDGVFAKASPAIQQWKKPICGFGTFLIGVPLAAMVSRKNAIEIGAGMAASFLQSLLVSAFAAANQPEIVNALSGYSNSRAYDLRGVRRRRGLRGNNQTSIMPRYTPVSGYLQAAAGYEQAAAGYEQAAAGTGEYFAPNGTGEYFGSNATGEYFAPANLQGVGDYEPAGQLAMQATAGTRQVISDGIRPDGDLDRQMDIMEAAAGLRGLGAYDEAVQNNGGVSLDRVGQQSQWVPNGPLWAGESVVNASQQTSEISAGILQRQGGNGVLSGG